MGQAKSVEAPQGQGRRAVRQAVAEGRNDRDVTRRLVDVLATLSLFNAAELRELTATVFKTYLVPGSESVAEANSTTNPLAQSRASPNPSRAEGAGRHRLQNLPGPLLGARVRSIGRGRSEIPRSSWRAERAEAHEQLGPPYVHVWVAFLRSLAATKGLAAEHVATVKAYWKSNVVKSAPVQLAAHVRHCRAKPCKKIEGKEGWTRIVFCLDPVTLPPPLPPSRGSAGSSTAAAERGEEARPRPTRPTRARSIEAADTDAGEMERLARRLELHSQRMAELLRSGVLEPSLAFAILMKKGGQQVPQPTSKAKAREDE